MENQVKENNSILDILFSPVTIGNLKLANRVVMAPMKLFKYSVENYHKLPKKIFAERFKWLD